jgi:hypothetical protein
VNSVREGKRSYAIHLEIVGGEMRVSERIPFLACFDQQAAKPCDIYNMVQPGPAKSSSPFQTDDFSNLSSVAPTKQIKLKYLKLYFAPKFDLNENLNNKTNLLC